MIGKHFEMRERERENEKRKSSESQPWEISSVLNKVYVYSTTFCFVLVWFFTVIPLARTICTKKPSYLLRSSSNVLFIIIRQIRD